MYNLSLKLHKLSILDCTLNILQFIHHHMWIEGRYRMVVLFYQQYIQRTVVNNFDRFNNYKRKVRKLLFNNFKQILLCKYIYPPFSCGFNYIQYNYRHLIDSSYIRGNMASSSYLFRHQKILPDSCIEAHLFYFQSNSHIPLTYYMCYIFEDIPYIHYFLKRNEQGNYMWED